MNDNTDNKPLAKVAILVLPPMILSSALLAGLSTEQAEAQNIGWDPKEMLDQANMYGVAPVRFVPPPEPMADALLLSGPIVVGSVAGVLAYRRPVRKKRGDNGNDSKGSSNSQPFDEPQQNIIAPFSTSEPDSQLKSLLLDIIIVLSSVLRIAAILSIVNIVLLRLDYCFLLWSDLPMCFIMFVIVLLVFSIPTITLGILIGEIARRIKISRNAGKTDIPDDTITTGDGRKQKRNS
jgi:hypothetical protein